MIVFGDIITRVLERLVYIEEATGWFQSAPFVFAWHRGRLSPVIAVGFYGEDGGGMGHVSVTGKDASGGLDEDYT